MGDAGAEGLHKVLALLEAAHAEAVTQLLFATQGAVLEVHDVLETLAQIVVPNLLAGRRHLQQQQQQKKSQCS
jgi:tRNA G18 (ribose-2'-O)-methylase SpoU